MTGRKLFGTDGIRGDAASVLDDDLVVRIARAVAHAASNGVLARTERPRIIVGRDTRVSGPRIEAAVVAGATVAGADVATGGVLPTAAVSYLTGLFAADAGIVISASHNPAGDNGIKLFGPGGWKLDAGQEREIERLIHEGVPDAPAAGADEPLEDAATAYGTHLASMASEDLRGMRVVIDCANGAAAAVIRPTVERLGLDAVILHDSIDGASINDGCGALHPEVVAAAAREHGAVGLTFDGDADRVLMSDETGRVIDGDAILAILARRLQDEGSLRNDAVVATVMANQAFRRWCAGSGIELHEVRVGDRYVLEEMRRIDAVLGGEQSGHVIRLDRATTGDGIAVGIAVLDALRAAGGRLADLVPFDPFPQVLVNVRTARRDEAEGHPAVVAACDAASARLGDDGRVLVRPSGTEQLVRVMVEAPDEGVAAAVATDVAAVVAAELSGEVS